MLVYPNRQRNLSQKQASVGSSPTARTTRARCSEPSTVLPLSTATDTAAGSIAAAVEQQGAATAEIARNVADPEQVAELVQCTAAEGWAASSTAGHRTLLRSRFKGWLQARPAFRPWCQYRAAATQIEAAGIPSNQTDDGLLVQDPSQNGVVLTAA